MKKILIIEDEPLQSAAVKQALSKNYDIQIAPDGVNGLAKLADFAPDLVLLDIVLPGGLNGLDVLRHIRSNPPTKAIPVIILTNLDNHEQEEARSLGATDYLLKTDVTLDDIEAKIKQYLPA